MRNAPILPLSLLEGRRRATSFSRRVAAFGLVCLACLCCHNDSSDGSPVTPRLSPIQRDEALVLAAFARNAVVEDDETGDEYPIAWSMVNWCCEERTLSLQYALARALRSGMGAPVVMRTQELSSDHILGLVTGDPLPFASINLAGPLACEQTILEPGGAPVEGDPQRLFWHIHHAVAMNVDGQLMVLDLSMADEPVSIQAWISSFVQDASACRHLGDPDFQKVEAYWRCVMSGMDPGPEPPCECAYTITPAFTWRFDQDVLVEAIQGVPPTLVVQSGAFTTLMQDSYGVDVSRDDIPRYLSLYEAKTMEDVCTWVDLPFCR